MAEIITDDLKQTFNGLDVGSNLHRNGWDKDGRYPAPETEEDQIILKLLIAPDVDKWGGHN